MKTRLQSTLEQYQATGRLAHQYPRLKKISLNGFRPITEKEAIARMQECIGKQWNAGKVKELLPPIKVLVNKTMYIGKICGRLNPFATVSVKSLGDVDIEISWPALARLLNADKPIKP